MEWKLIADFMPEARRGRPRTYAGRTLVNAIRYVARSGCSWRMLPADFPLWSSVFHHYQRWTKLGLWADIASALLPLTRVQAERDEAPHVVILDARSTRSACGGDALGIDGNKKGSSQKTDRKVR
jgi:putative transposase